jgi:hypothetical protein
MRESGGKAMSNVPTIIKYLAGKNSQKNFLNIFMNTKSSLYPLVPELPSIMKVPSRISKTRIPLDDISINFIYILKNPNFS